MPQQYLEILQRVELYRTLYVTETGEDVATNRPPYNMSLPYKTLLAAKNAARSGDTIVVAAGTYQMTESLLKNGVNWHFLPGATVVNDLTPLSKMEGSAVTQAIFDDLNTAIVSKITGSGTFLVLFGIQRWDDGEALPIDTNVNRYTFVRLRHASSDVTIEFERATYSGYSSGGRQMVYIEDCLQCTLRGRALDRLNVAQTFDIAVPPAVNGPYFVPDSYGGIWWKKGETYIDIDVIVSGVYSLYPEGEGVATPTNLWVRANRIESLNGATIYFNGAANPNYKLWVTAQEIIASGVATSGTTPNNVLHLQGIGKVYIDALKIGCVGGGSIGYASGHASGPMEVWISAQKFSCGDSNGLVAFKVGVAGSNTNIVYLTAQHIEATLPIGSPAFFIETNGANSTLYINGGVFKMSTNYGGINHIAGKTVATGVRIECNATNDVDNIPVKIGGAGCILDGCTLLAPALADSIDGSGTVKIYGTTYANKAKDAAVTVQAGLGTLVVDVNVT